MSRNKGASAFDVKGQLKDYGDYGDYGDEDPYYQQDPYGEPYGEEEEVPVVKPIKKGKKGKKTKDLPMAYEKDLSGPESGENDP